MGKFPKLKYSELLRSNDRYQQQLNDIVLQSLDDEKLIADKLKDPEDDPKFANRLSDAVARFGGSWRFILAFLGVIVVWIIVNSFVLASRGFDPYPYILLNLILSCVAALQAPVIMMSQNRQEEKDRHRAMNDYAVNLKAEIELRNLQLKMDLLAGDQFKLLLDSQAQQLAMIRDLQKKLDTEKSKITEGVVKIKKAKKKNLPAEM